MEIKNIPSEARTAFQGFLSHIQGYGDTVDRLYAAIATFGQGLIAAQQSHEFVDSELAKDLMQKSLALLDLCRASPREPFVPYALAAIVYFTEKKDGHPDFENIDGFDDDQDVLAAVIDHFALKDRLARISAERSVG